MQKSESFLRGYFEILSTAHNLEIHGPQGVYKILMWTFLIDALMALNNTENKSTKKGRKCNVYRHMTPRHNYKHFLQPKTVIFWQFKSNTLFWNKLIFYCQCPGKILIHASAVYKTMYLERTGQLISLYKNRFNIPCKIMQTNIYIVYQVVSVCIAINF